ncbi:MAG: ribosome maturation factor RimP [Clostridiales bacterium]|jgi:ribosome maturation factor RimP|nr:ribosome maturation factor RimP [Clostridiales bacterium]
MEVSSILENIEHIVVPMIEELGYEFVDVEFVEEEEEWYLRVYIDNVNGITVEDCAAVSRPISEKLDELDPIDISYYFEVSSPGINRIIKKDRDFDRFNNSKVKITLLSKFEGKEVINGVLKGLQDNSILVQYNNKIININRENVKAVNLNDF